MASAAAWANGADVGVNLLQDGKATSSRDSFLQEAGAGVRKRTNHCLLESSWRWRMMVD
jgi:hypothetical protein